MDDRPPLDPATLLEEWSEWERGDELPGRVMSNLKKGRLPDVLAEHEAADLISVWQEWEKGKTGPADVLARLKDGGLGDLIRGLAPAE